MTLERRQLVQTTAVAIARTTGVQALVLARLCGREGPRGDISITGIECSNTQREKHRREHGDDDERLLAGFHGSDASGRTRRPIRSDVVGNDLQPLYIPSAFAVPFGLRVLSRRQGGHPAAREPEGNDAAPSDYADSASVLSL